MFAPVLPGAAPEEVESLVTQQIEEVVNTVDGINELRSISGQGTSFVIATFKLDRDLESAAQDVRDRVNTSGPPTSRRRHAASRSEV